MAKQEQVINIKIQTGKATVKTKKLNKDLATTGATGTASGLSIGAAFKAAGTGIMTAIPALQAFKAALISTGVGAIVVAVGSLVGLLVSAAGKAKEFEKALSGLQAVSGASSESMEQLSNQAKELGASTAFTASQVLQLQTELAKLGFSVSDIQNSTPAILDLAASLDVSLSEAAAFAGSQIRAFGLDTSETQRVVDVMALSTTKSALDFGSLSESLKMAAPVMKATGQSVERTAAMLGVLADTGIKGSLAGTGLSKTFIALNKEGISLEDAMNKVSNSSDQLGTAVELVGVVGAKSLLNLANNAEKIDELEESFNKASDTVEQGGKQFDGAAKAIAEMRLDNLEGDTTKLGSAWEGFLLAIEDGDGIINKIQRTIVQGLTIAITGATKAVEFFGFLFGDIFEANKLIMQGARQIIGGGFLYLVGQITKAANNILIQISRIPIIGAAIDANAAQKRVKMAAAIIDRAEDEIRKGRDAFVEVYNKGKTFAARYQAKAEANEILREEKAKNAELAEIQEEKLEQDKEAAEKAKKQREDDLKKLLDLEKKYLQRQQDLDDTTSLQKAQRQRERAQAELDALKLSNEEKIKAQEALNNYFDQLEEEAAAKDQEKIDKQNEKDAADKLKKQEERLKELELDKEFEALQFEERRAILDERRRLINEDELLSEEQKLAALANIQKAEEKLDQDKVAGKMAALDAVRNLAGAETRVGQALLLAKQILQMKEMMMDLKNITFKGKKALAETAVDAGQNVSKSAKIGFPQNIITIAAAIGQGISIMNTVKKAVSRTGAGASAPPPPTPPPVQEATAQAENAGPAFNVIGASGTNQIADALAGQQQAPIQTFVVASEVTSEQALERNIVDSASI